MNNIALWLAIYGAGLSTILVIIRVMGYFTQQRRKLRIDCEIVKGDGPSFENSDGSWTTSTSITLRVRVVNLSVRAISLYKFNLKTGTQHLICNPPKVHNVKLGEGESFEFTSCGYGLKRALEAEFRNLKEAEFKIEVETTTGKHSRRFRLRSIPGCENLLKQK